MSKCERCGACCLTVGRTFWKNGDFKYEPELATKANGEEWDVAECYQENTAVCEMFELRGEIGICLIHERYGYKAKPKACREYPDGELCFREKGV